MSCFKNPRFAKASDKTRAGISYEVEIVDQVQEKVTASEEEVLKLIVVVREKEKKVSVMIYLFSNIIVKDEETQEEYVIEQSYIKQLLSDESRNTGKCLLPIDDLGMKKWQSVF